MKLPSYYNIKEFIESIQENNIIEINQPNYNDSILVHENIELENYEIDESAVLNQFPEITQV